MTIDTMLNGTSLFLVGMMGAGKSTVGRLVARQLNYQFFDTDTLIEDCTGQTIPEIFASSGEAGFRQIERQVLAEIAAYTKLVVATGGGIVLDPLNWSYLHNGIVVWLDVPVDILHHRLASSSHRRPLLETDDPKAVLSSIYNLRRDRYAQADIQLAIEEHESSQTVCDRLIAAVSQRIEPERLKHLN